MPRSPLLLALLIAACGTDRDVVLDDDPTETGVDRPGDTDVADSEVVDTEVPADTDDTEVPADTDDTEVPGDTDDAEVPADTDTGETDDTELVVPGDTDVVDTVVPGDTDVVDTVVPGDTDVVDTVVPGDTDLGDSDVTDTVVPVDSDPGDSDTDLASDADGDGSRVPDDCDDRDPDVYPGAPDLCDGKWNGCGPRPLSVLPILERQVVTLFRPDGVAVDLTPTFSGDVALPDGRVQVCPGTYDVRLEVPDRVDVELIGFGGRREDIVIDAGGLGTVLTVEGTATVRGLTLTNGSAVDGGGVAVLAGSLDASDAAITACTAKGDGGGLWVDGLGDATLSDVDLRGNEAGGDGGGAASEGLLELVDVTLDGNDADGWGGGLAIVDGDVALAGVTLSGNTAGGSGGGMFVAVHGEPTFRDLTVVDNAATDDGGGAALTLGSDLTIEASTFDRNQARGGGQVAAGVDGAAVSFALRDVTLLHGVAWSNGGGIVFRGLDLVLDAVTIEGNRAHTGGGVSAYEATFTVTDSKITDNDAGTGTGGGLWANASVGRLARVTLSGNTADAGGGLALERGGRVTLTACPVSGNHAGDGGGVWISNGAEVDVEEDTVVEGNDATRGGGAYVAGATLTCTGNGLFPDRTGFLGNTAATKDAGAGVLLTADAALELVWCDLGASGSVDDNVGGGVSGQDVTNAKGTTRLDDDVTGTCDALTCP